jgi:predicted HicB family RNase H-like nuclease
MKPEKTMGTPVDLINVTICFPHLFEKHAAPGTTNARYSAEFILDPVRNRDTLDKLAAAFRQVATEAGKGDQLQYLDPPYKEGAKVNMERQRKGKAPRPELEGKFMIRGSSATDQPVVVNAAVHPISEANRGMIFSGCMVNAYVDLYWSSNTTNPGVFCGLNGVQLVDNVNVERIGGGRPSAEAMFSPVAGAPEPIAPGASEPDAPSWL